MEVIQEGKNFRLVSVDELPEILNVLAKYLPSSLKVRFHFYMSLYHFYQFFIFTVIIYISIYISRDQSSM